MKRIYADGKEIAIEFPYSAGMVDLVKKLPDRKFVNDPPHWILPLDVAHSLVAKKFANEWGFEFDPKLTKLISDRDKQASKPIPQLRDYQAEAVKFIYLSGGRLVLAMDMGTGKTITSLAYAKKMDFRKILVVSPASVLYKWQDEVTRWLNWDSHVLTSNEVPDSRVLITSYDRMWRIDELQKKRFDLIVADECHYLKNKETLRYKGMKKLKSNAFLGLSGTPFLNRPVELWTTLNLIAPAYFSNFYGFANRYCRPVNNGFGVTYAGVSNEEELKGILKSYMYRVTKADVLDELPEMQRIIIPVEADRKEYVKEWRMGGDPLSKLTRLRHWIGLQKVGPALELAEEILSGEQVVLYAHHKDVVAQLVKGLSAYRVGTIIGEDSAEERQATVTKFQNKQLDVLVISSAGGEGIDLYSASKLIFVEQEWNPGKEAQIEARLHRIGQQNSVNIYKIVASNTLDQHIYNLIEKKRELASSVYGLDTIETSIIDDLLSLIQSEEI